MAVEEHELALKVWEKIKADYEEVEAFYKLKKPVDVMNMAYKIAVMQNFMDSFERTVDDIDNCEDDENVCISYTADELQKILNFKGNILNAFAEGWGMFRHPERFDFWGYDQDDTPDIISEIVNNCLEHIQGGSYFERN